MEWELSPVVHESISQFSAMNDDCLLALFKPLNFFDSVALANTCTRMMALFREHGICDKMLDFTTLKQRFINWLDVFEYMLVGYGSQLRHLSIDNYTYARSLDQVLFNMINKYCSAGNLRSLSFEGMEIGKSFVRNSTVVLNNLRSLNITHCRINDGCLAELLANCPKLEHLKLEKYDIRYGTRLLNPLLSIVSPHLRSITMSSCHVDIAPDTLRQVLAKTPKLETFVYREVSMPQHNDNPYDVIAEMLPNLKKFTYNVRSDQRIVGIHRLAALRSLESLKVSLPTNQELHLADYLVQAAQNGNLRKLSMASDQAATHPFSSLTAALSQVTSLRKLKISQMPKVTGRIMEIAGKLPWLQKLIIDEISPDLCGINKKELVKFLDIGKHVQSVKFHFIASLSGERFLPIDQDFVNDLRAVIGKRAQEERSLTLQFCCTRNESQFRYRDEMIGIDCEHCNCNIYLA